MGLFGFVMGGLQLAFVTYLSLFLREAHGYRLAVAGISLAVTMAAGTLGRLLWAVISDRFFADRRASGLRLNALLSVAGMAGLALLPSGALIWPCVALVGFANIGWNGVYMTLVAETAPSGRIGRVSGSSLRKVFAGSVVRAAVARPGGRSRRLAGGVARRLRPGRVRRRRDDDRGARAGARGRATIV